MNSFSHSPKLRLGAGVPNAALRRAESKVAAKAIMRRTIRDRRRSALRLAMVGAASSSVGVLIAGLAVAGVPPCRDPAGTAEARAERTVEALSQAEKLSLVQGVLGAPWGGRPKPEGAIGSAGYVPGIPRLGVPALQETDGPLGVANPGDIRRGDTATAMPSNTRARRDLGPRAGAPAGRERRRGGAARGGSMSCSAAPRT